jgi:purine-cytosine permease-like protein
MKRAPIIATLVLLFGPAVVTAFSRTAGMVTAACAVVVLVYLVLEHERPGGGHDR